MTQRTRRTYTIAERFNVIRLICLGHSLHHACAKIGRSKNSVACFLNNIGSSKRQILELNRTAKLSPREIFKKLFPEDAALLDEHLDKIGIKQVEKPEAPRLALVTEKKPANPLSDTLDFLRARHELLLKQATSIENAIKALEA